jgi:hypothetical protein
MILKGDNYEKIKETNHSITEAKYHNYKIKCKSDSTLYSSKWGEDIRDLNLGTHKLGLSGYAVAQPKWDRRTRSVPGMAYRPSSQNTKISNQELS